MSNYSRSAHMKTNAALGSNKGSPKSEFSAMAWIRRWLQGRRDAKLSVKHGHSSFNFTQSQQSQPVHWSHLDSSLVWLIFGVLVFGWVMVYSASIAIPDNPRFSSIGEAHFVLRHGLNLAIGAVLATLAFRVPMDLWRKLAPWIFGLSVLLLIVVFLPGVGVIRNGARRWVDLGPMNFQPSELAKLGILLYASDYMVRKVDVQERFWTAVYPMLLALMVVGFLLLAEPDMGAFMVITVIALGILFFGGVNARMFILTAITTVMAFATILYFSDWRRERILAYLDPWSTQHALDKGYQLTNSLIGIGRGEIFGVGLGASLEKLHWLPEVHTDFITAVIGEELGLVGLLSLVLVFAWIVHRMMSIGRQAIVLDKSFSGLVAQGVGLWLGFQAFVNMGVNLGVLPTKGLTLPLISYGGSALVFNLIALALVLRVDYENRRIMAGRTAS